MAEPSEGDTETPTHRLFDNESIKRILEEKLDEKDYQIFQVLNQNGRISDTELGERVGLSRTAARRRRRNLQEEGVLDVIAVLILQEVEMAYADVRVKFSTESPPGEIDAFVEGLLHEELIFEVDEYMGEYDLLLRIWHATLRDVKTYTNQLLQSSQVVESYETHPVIRTRKAWHKVFNGDS